ncbi:hypothetical protein NE237_005471 [Protea cynaroides]|uniref:Uncharacterized protein n=1 Tax=Protea cynaroides TaxID=273540 RepID=A0A9Q0QUL2_9MAGN|nr:hypothetical protein NE237_005471 [Protea cynaroides]
MSIKSTDLEFPHDLPVIRLRPAPSTLEDQQDNTNNEAIQNSLNHNEYGWGTDGDNECRTPTSDDHKIPVMRSCPDAPRKQTGVVLCKRKLSHEFRFFEITGRDQVESFFNCYSFSVKKSRRSNSNSKSNS